MSTLAQAAALTNKRNIKMLRREYMLHAINEGLASSFVSRRGLHARCLGTCQFTRNGISIAKTEYAIKIMRGTFCAAMARAKSLRAQLEILPG